MKGQINLGSICGDSVKDICQLEDTKNIVEIGTWNGEGTTQCILAGLQEDATFWSLECDKAFFDKAREVVPKQDNIHLIHGSLVKIHELDRSNLSEEERLWLSNDERVMEGIPDVLHLMPETIDFLVLDGGEFSTRQEFLLLKDRSKIILLDDTNIRKNRLNKEELDRDEDFDLMYEYPNDRHGWACYVRK